MPERGDLDRLQDILDEVDLLAMALNGRVETDLVTDPVF